VADADSPEAWIRTVAVNLAKRRRRRRVMLERILRQQPESEAEPETAGTHLDLHRAIRTLGEDQRAVVVLHYLADLPVTEVAEILGIPVGTVKSRLARARATLTIALDSEVEHA